MTLNTQIRLLKSKRDDPKVYDTDWFSTFTVYFNLIIRQCPVTGPIFVRSSGGINTDALQFMYIAKRHTLDISEQGHTPVPG